jgi:hypothetical protein
MRAPFAKIWIGRVILAAASAVSVNLGLSALEVEHDAPMVALLTVATFAAGVLALESLEAQTQLPWTAPRPDARPHPGEDTRTAMFRHMIEAHEGSKDADDTVLWQIADLAKRRLRQVHGIRYADDPGRATALLGPQLADLVSRDRRHRYQPGRRRRRYSVEELGQLVQRVEQL